MDSKLERPLLLSACNRPISKIKWKMQCFSKIIKINNLQHRIISDELSAMRPVG